MITLMGSKDIFKPSTFPKKKRKHEQNEVVATPRSVKYKPSIESFNLLTRPRNEGRGKGDYHSETDTSFEASPNAKESDSKLNDSFISQSSRTRDMKSAEEEAESPSAVPPSLSTPFMSRSNQSPTLPHINIGQNLTLPSRHVNESLQIHSVQPYREVMGPQALSQHLPEPRFAPLQPLHDQNTAPLPNYPHRQQESQYYHPTTQQQQRQQQGHHPFQLVHQPQTGSYTPSLMQQQQQAPAMYPYNDDYFPSYQQPPQIIQQQSQFVPMHVANYYQQPIPSQSSAPHPHPIYYNVVPYSVAADPYFGLHGGIPRKSRQSSTWSAEEDKLLRELKEVQKLGWREISTFFHERTPNACQFRWRRIISNLDSSSKGGTNAEASDKEKDSNVSSSAEVASQIHQGRKENLIQGRTTFDKATSSKKEQSHINKIDFLLN
ncbi:hypothetical protein CANMA_000082 [Candida margitis]|uniref:uncharacterized protein n=1 Tax=Candida margitis TaxID=1775924 RepID=UPI0022261951|nr:uncharacterized protein CANMA_000082 [Candida margitis]KAI5970922.1 hypothetical protein CANMA_000082 [Candida margitis]